MARTSFATFPCSVARTLEVLGGDWTPLILRDIGMGVTRFSAIQRSLGLSRKLLSERLAALVDEGILERVAYQEHPPRYDYVPTEKGMELAVVLLALQAWGDRWTAGEAGVPLRWTHVSCGQPTTPQLSCSCCGEPLHPSQLLPELGPGFRHTERTAELAAAVGRWRGEEPA